MRRNTRFADVVKGLVGSQSQREVARKVGISPTYVGDLLWGVVPSYKLLQRVAEGLELSPAATAELFEAAGYAPPVSADEEEPEESGAAILNRVLAELAPLRIEPQTGLWRWLNDSGSLSPEDARKIAAELRRQREQGII